MNAMSAAVAATPVTSTLLCPTPVTTTSDLASMVFGMMAEGGDQKVIREELYRLAKVILAIDRAEIAQERLRLQKRREEAVSSQPSGFSQNGSARTRETVAELSAETGETPRPPASARVETAVGSQRSAVGPREPVSGEGSGRDQELALIGQVLGPEFERLAPTLSRGEVPQRSAWGA